MLNSVFWYTGIVAWLTIVFGCLTMLIIDARDRSIRGARSQVHRWPTRIRR
jgi:hypothetical protein